MSSHSKKKVRFRREGGPSQHFVPFGNDDYRDVYYREGYQVKLSIGNLPTTSKRTVQKSNEQWQSATSWTVADDTEFALDPDNGWYDEAVDGSVMDGPIEAEVEEPARKKRKKSKVSQRPHIVWKDLHRAEYLDEMLRWKGRGDFRASTQCPDCVSRSVETPPVPLYRCLECFCPDLVCQACCIRRHSRLPLHRIEMWNGKFFSSVSLKALGLRVQLNHASLYCPNPTSCHTSMVVLHMNGLHEVAFNYCGCDRALPSHIQLLRRQFYPGSQLFPKTCATFQLLDHLHKFALTSKTSTYDAYRALEKLTNNTGIDVPKSRYRALMRISLQWRHLKLLKWAGRGHDPAGVEATKPGELGLRCPTCPYPGINLPEDWEDAPPEMQFLYTLFVCMDANFRLKNQLVSNYSQDPGLGIGWAYMLPREGYESYVLGRANDQDVSTCVGFQALAQANNRFSKGLRYTGVGGAFCGRSEMVLPNGVGNLQKGERYANMDFVFASAIRHILVPLVLISYDICCQWFINLFVRMTTQWPEDLRIPPTTRVIPAIPKLHEPMHQRANHQVFSLNFIPGVGNSDFECPERFWAPHNPVGNSTKTQGPGSRHDVLDDHFGFFNWLKYSGMGKTLMRKYRAAVAERNKQSEAHRGLTASLDPTVVEAWEGICVAWDQDTFPKTAVNPYQTTGATLTEAQARKELAQEEEQRLAGGGEALHATSASAFIAMGLDIEDTQRKLRRHTKETSSTSTARQQGSLTEQRNQLTNRIRVWEQLRPLYMPALLQYHAELHASNSFPSSAEHSEDLQLWLPSQIPTTARRRVCGEALSNIEERLRTAQCYDALENLRNILRIKNRLVHFKHHNVRGQREGTRSRAVIDRVHERARTAALKYREARHAKLELTGAGDWEKELEILADDDIRGLQDPNRLKKSTGRRGTLEDSQVNSQENEVPLNRIQETSDFTLFNEERTQRDGTGETRRTLSWIWSMAGVSTADPTDAVQDESFRAEWAKSRARAKRSQEEVQMIQEEMRRDIKYLEWSSSQWLLAKTLRDGSGDLIEGLQAYADSQSALQLALAASFKKIWNQPLQDAQDDSNETGEDDEEADDEEEDIVDASNAENEVSVQDDDRNIYL